MKKLIGGLAILTIAIVAGVGLSSAANGDVLSYQKISDTEGEFTAILDNSDNFGYSVTKIGDLNEDGITDIAVGAPFDDDGGANRGAIYILFLNTNGTVDSFQKVSEVEGNLQQTLVNSDNFGSSITSIGDLNSDGVIDLVVGADNDDDGSFNRGAVYVLFMNSNGTVSSSQKISDTAGSFTAVLENNDRFGSSVAHIGDFDEDGVPDIAVGAYGDDDGGGDYGAVYILFLNTNGTVDSFQKISSLTGGFSADMNEFDQFGYSVALVGDLDGNSVPELAVGARLDDDGGTGAGAVYILFMNSNGTVSSNQKISATSENFTDVLETYDYFGTSIAGIGDLNQDDIPDIVVGSEQSSDGGGTGQGAVHIVYLQSDGSVLSSVRISDGASNFEASLDNTDFFGNSVASLDDFDGDGFTDIAVGAFYDGDGGTNRGSVYILNLDGSIASSSGSTPAPTPPSPPTFNIVGDSVCTWDNILYAEVEAAQTVAVYVADNERFVSSQQYIYQSGNAAAVLPEELQSSANPSKMYISWTIPEETREESIYELFALARGTNGALSAIVTDSIEYSSVTDCDYPFAAERDAEGNIVSTTPGSGNGGEETESGITPVSPGDLIKAEGTSTVYYVTQSLTKRPFTEYSIYLTWGGDSALKLVTPATLPTLQTGEPMLPKGPAIIYFEGNPNPHYIDGANNAPREQTVQNVLQDLLGSSFRRDLHQTVPAYLEDHITKGREITRANELTILREWRNFIRGL